MNLVEYYSKKKDGNKYISKNFKLKEMACKDGSDVVFVSPELVMILQKVRDRFGKPVTINSGYRTVTYNKKIGGATSSQHCYGTAADIKVKGATPKEVYDYLDDLLGDKGGLGLYSTFTHVDVRPVKARWKG